MIIMRKMNKLKKNEQIVQIDQNLKQNRKNVNNH